MTETPQSDVLRDRLLSLWPDHAAYLTKSFAGRADDVLAVSEQLAGYILTLAAHHAGGLDALCADYRFLCEEIVLPEELHFRRTGQYRLSNFADADAQVYANAPYMARYVNGILLSQLFWLNHASAFAHFATRYLPALREGSAHLEIGPGHGLFLHFAALSSQVTSVAGWDISPTSIAATKAALTLLNCPVPVQLTLQNMFDAPASDARFDSVTMSEILEHLEDPVAALRAVKAHIAPGGRIFVNVPANSPAPDHIFLIDSLAHAVSLLEQAGFSVIDQAAYPMAGATLAQAEKHRLSVSCVVVGQA